MESDGTEIFGPGNTWAALYEYVHKAVRSRFYWRDDSLLADAASEGYERAVAKTWTKLSTDSSADLDRNWTYVKRIARLEAGSYLAKEDSRPEMALSSVMPVGLSADAEQDFLDLLASNAYVEQPDTLTEDGDLRERAYRALRELAQDETEWNTWLRDLVAGLTERAAAKQQGVHQTTINRRRARGLERIQPVLTRHGLVKEDL